jgi:hypothetical protein
MRQVVKRLLRPPASSSSTAFWGTPEFHTERLPSMPRDGDLTHARNGD